VPENEPLIHLVKERTGAKLHTLPSTYIPKVMLVAMVANSAKWINAVLAKDGLSATLIQRRVLTGKGFDYKKHCRAFSPNRSSKMLSQIHTTHLSQKYSCAIKMSNLA
jgi:hypothetical protein